MEATVIEEPLTSSVLVRAVSHEDAAAVVELTRQLGHEVSVERISEQIQRLSSCAASQVVFVACVGSEVVGWIEAAIAYHLQSVPYSLIGGLVVRDGMRSLGVGKRLCAEVEAWSREKGIAVVRVTSRITRERAHRFYLREGYEQIKTSAVFEKVLP
jgi:predicted N-acetyltransferase YhbS